MAASMDSDDEESFVSIGTPLEIFEEDEARKKPVSVHDLPVKDSRGRTRFHGAFTGGFSAGFFNTVGSKEGFQPSSFVSSRSSKEEKIQQRPEDFMDDEDFSEHGIAPKKLATSATYTSEERGQKRKALSVASAGSSVIPGAAAALADLIVPDSLPIGVQLLRKMGWKEGQGVGPRQRRKKKTKAKVNTGKKIIGCALPPSDHSSEESDDDAFKDMTFAPKDKNPISLKAKDNVHGLGYSGLDPKSALPSGHINLFEPPPVKGKGRKGIKGQAFGVGALEDEDDDIYAVDHLSNYDMTMELEEKDNRFGWTAPGQNKKGKQQVPVGYVGKLLEGFQLSSKPLKPKKVFRPPVLPAGFRPVHRFLKPCDSVTSDLEKHNAVSRGVVLGETPIFKSVFDLMPKSDQKRVENVKESLNQHQAGPSSTGLPSGHGRDPGLPSDHGRDCHSSMSSSDLPSSGPSTANPQKGALPTGPRTSRFSQSVTEGESKPAAAPSTALSTEEQHTRQQSLLQGNLSSFQPFARDPAKQKRYEKYLALHKQGNKDPYKEEAESVMTEWEKEHEKEEFFRAAKLYKPLSAMMATRFTTAKFADDVDKADVPVNEGEKSEQAKAAEMKMFGRLTREDFEWHPDKLLCRRFNVPHPYPGSTIVGLPTVKRDKYSVFNFLEFPSGQMSGSKSSDQDPPPAAIEYPEPSLKEPKQSSEPQSKKPGTSFTIHSKSRPALSSIFSVLYEDEKKQEKTKKTHMEEEKITDTAEVHLSEEIPRPTADSTPEDGNLPTLDLFRAIFKNSDSDDSSSDSEDEQEQKSEPVAMETPAEETNKVQELVDKGTNEKTDADKSRPEENSYADYLPGAPIAMETITQRLSPTTLLSDDEMAYGPALPPPNTNVTPGPSLSTAHVIDLTTDQHRKHKHKHKDKNNKKHKKEKKAKYKKSKHKKKEKKNRRRRSSSEDNDSDSSDTEGRSSKPSDQEILERLKSVGGQRLKAADFM